MNCIGDEPLLMGNGKGMLARYKKLWRGIERQKVQLKFEKERLIGDQYLGWLPDQYCYGLKVARDNFVFQQNDVLLDLGCGFSSDIVKLAYELGPLGVKVVGLDACPENIGSIVAHIKRTWRRCLKDLLQHEGEKGWSFFLLDLRSRLGIEGGVREDLSDFKLPENLKLLNEDMRKTSLQPDSVDKVISAHALTDVTAEETLEKILEVTRVGGEILLSPDNYWKMLYAIAKRKGIELAEPKVIVGIGASAFIAKVLSKGL